MADTQTERAGVRQTSGERRNQRQGSWFKKHKGLAIAGGGLGAILLLSHKGGSSASGSGTDQGQLQAYQAGVQDAGTLMGPGGGNSTQPPVNVTVVNPPPTRGNHKPPKPHRKPPKPHRKPPVRKPPKGHGQPSKHRHGAGRPSPTQHHHPSGGVAPKAPHTHKPGPAGRSGKPRATPHATRKGHAKGSPAEAASLQVGEGVTIMGKQFLGARGHIMGPPRVGPGNRVMRNVTVFYDGHTEYHTVGPRGEWWELNSRGRSPMGRGVPQLARGGGAE